MTRLRAVTGPEDSAEALDIYLSNPDYFALVGNPCPTLSDIAQDAAALPPGAKPEQKLYRLLGSGEGLIDLILDYPAPGEAFIGLFLVHGRLHRQGRGSRLIREIEKWLKEQGCKRLRLAVIEGNDGALAFWKSLGFEETDRFTAQMQSGPMEAVRMAKAI